MDDLLAAEAELDRIRANLVGDTLNPNSPDWYEEMALYETLARRIAFSEAKTMDDAFVKLRYLRLEVAIMSGDQELIRLIGTVIEYLNGLAET